MEKLLTTLASDPSVGRKSINSTEKLLTSLASDPRVERLRRMNLEELEAFGNEDHTGVEHTIAEHFLVEKLITDYVEKTLATGETPCLTGFANHKYWTDALWRYVGDNEDSFHGRWRQARLTAYATDFFLKYEKYE